VPIHVRSSGQDEGGAKMKVAAPGTNATNYDIFVGQINRFTNVILLRPECNGPISIVLRGQPA
jgi:hypothetical protein